MRKKLLAGNWKMHKLAGELPGFFTEFVAALGTSPDKVADRCEVLFAAPYTLLAKASELATPRGIRIAAQNVHFEAQGAYTGEISLPMLKDIGVLATLIGHSERRQYYNETDETVQKKTAAALAAGVTPIVCVGETLAERDGGTTDSVVRRQVEAAVAGIKDPKDLVIAYEPVWAIGTGRSATSAQAQDVHKLIRKVWATLYGDAHAAKVRILYGGSANPANIAELLKQPDIDGGLVGGASLKPADFATMVRVTL